MIKQIPLFILLSTILGLSSCNDKPRVVDDIVLPPKETEAVWIINEGNFQFGNASLSVLDIGNNKLLENVFENKNNRKLGDVFQSISMINNKVYLVVNNSQKIELCEPATFLSEKTILGFTSPRTITKVNNNKAYVTEYYANAIRIVDLTSNQISGSIPLDGWSEEMIVINDIAYVTNPKKEFIYLINTNLDLLVDSIQVGMAPISILLDPNFFVWVLCKGALDKSIAPSLHRIAPLERKVIKTIRLPKTQRDATKLCIDKTRGKLFWLSKDIYSCSIIDTINKVNLFINGEGKNFYGLNVNPNNHEVYVSDAKDYVQKSNISRYDQDGILKGDFLGGICTNGFFFYKP